MGALLLALAKSIYYTSEDKQIVNLLTSFHFRSIFHFEITAS